MNNNQHAKKLVELLTERPIIKPYSISADEKVCVEIIEKYLDKIKK